MPFVIDRKGGSMMAIGENILSFKKPQSPLDLKAKKVVVVGLGRSGVSAIRLLAEKGADVSATDLRSRQELTTELESLGKLPVHFVFGEHPNALFKQADLIVVSPGVPVSLVSRFGRPIIGDVELAYQCLDAPWIAITGTNGKSTTTALVGEIFRAWGKVIFVGGNLGVPACEAVLANTAYDWVIAEMSSFQLETIKEFRPKISAFLNISPNHLDRYPDFSDYLKAKVRILMNQNDQDWSVLNSDDPVAGPEALSVASRVAAFSRKAEPSCGVWLEGNRLMSNIHQPEEIARRSDVRLRGEHNLENVMSAIAISQLSGCPSALIRRTLGQFGGLEHRLEVVRNHRGVLFVNDSKATTIAAMGCAIRSFQEPIVLIAGGRSKRVDFSSLRAEITDKVRAVILIGESRDAMQSALEGKVAIYSSDDLSDAVSRALTLTLSGDVVLLSPGCSSFDMFLDFEERGRQFKRIVSLLN